jgi:hypothetical protein
MGLWESLTEIGRKIPEIANMKSRFIESINVHRLLIAELSFFLAAAVVIISIFGLRNESLLFVVLIFGIYLIISGRVSQFKFMNLEIVIRDIEIKQPELTEVGLTPHELDPQYIDKGPTDKLESQIIPKLIHEAKKVRILRIKEIKDEPDYPSYRYDHNAIIDYLRYFTHVVFIDNNMRLCGFATADELLKKIEQPSEGKEYVEQINKWILNDPIKKDTYIVKGASRKQVLDRMKELNLTVLPVVSGYLIYEGIVDKDSIMLQITKDFYRYAKKNTILPVF